MRAAPRVQASQIASVETDLCPQVGSRSLRISRPSVDFPEPDSPTRPSVSPGKISRLTAVTALTVSRSRAEQRVTAGGKFLAQVFDADQRRARVGRRGRRARRIRRGYRRHNDWAPSLQAAARFERIRESRGGIAGEICIRRADCSALGIEPGIACRRSMARAVDSGNRREQPARIRIERICK